MSTLVKWTLIILGILAAVAAWYFLWYLPSQGSSTSSTSGPQDGDPCILTEDRTSPREGIIQNGVCVPLNVNPASNRMTAIQANNILNQYGIKDSAGRPTLHYSGGFDSPDTANFPASQLQAMLRNGWWFGLLTGGTLNGFKPGDNGEYLLAIYDLRDSSATINAGKSQVYIPSTLTPYIIY